jgi:hypothetical protein
MSKREAAPPAIPPLAAYHYVQPGMQTHPYPTHRAVDGARRVTRRVIPVPDELWQ